MIDANTRSYLVLWYPIVLDVLTNLDTGCLSRLAIVSAVFRIHTIPHNRPLAVINGTALPLPYPYQTCSLTANVRLYGRPIER